MKFEFSHEITFIPDFNKNKELPEAEQITVKIKPLILFDLLDLTDVLKQAGFEKGDSKDVSQEQMRAIVGQGGKYVPKYCSLIGAEGFDLNDVVNYAHFLPLATEILFTLITNSSPTVADVKN